MSADRVPIPGALRARTAVAVVFVFNGLVLAGWMSRLPLVRDALGLDPAGLGLLILVGSLGSLVGLPLAGALTARWGARRVVATGAVLVCVAQVAAGFGVAAGSIAGTAAGLVVMGLGLAIWDVAMNLHGAQVEQRLGRTIMPRFHAAFSLGTALGAGGGALAATLGLPLAVHLGLVDAAVLAVAWWACGRFLPHDAVRAQGRPPSARRAWTEPRTLAIGLMVLALALTEGTANDWLAVALVDGHGASDQVGALGFALFVTAMTAGRLVGGTLLDRHGRPLVLWSTMALAGLGVLLTVTGTPTVSAVGIALWGLGASLGFPVGMSAAADDPQHAAARISVVSTIGYTAFLAGPPLLGLVGERVGTLNALLVVALVLVPSAAAVPAARARPVSRP